MFEKRPQSHVEEKQRISLAAIKELPESGVLMVDAGTTPRMVCEALPADHTAPRLGAALHLTVAQGPHDDARRNHRAARDQNPTTISDLAAAREPLHALCVRPVDGPGTTPAVRSSVTRARSSRSKRCRNLSRSPHRADVAVGDDADAARASDGAQTPAQCPCLFASSFACSACGSAVQRSRCGLCRWIRRCRRRSRFAARGGRRPGKP